ncbi:hypothetical protein [Aureliella helgolandensis]|nr:hypothetical protein [Aureliella helgolandensis]
MNININVNIRVPTTRSSESDYIVPIVAEVLASSALFEDTLQAGAGDFVADTPEEFVVGRVWAERLDCALAEQHGFPLLHICDAASGAWLHAYETLTQKKSDHFRNDLVEDFVADVIFVHEALIHPEIEDRLAVMSPVLQAISCDSSLLLMQHEYGQQHHLEDAEYRDLGFKKIALSNLLLRDNHFRHPFTDEHPHGREIAFFANIEHEEWLNQNWDSLIVDHPSL